MEKQVYVVVLEPSGKIGTTTRKTVAIAAAKKHGGKVYAVPWAMFSGSGAVYGVDLPTVMATGDLILSVPANRRNK